MAAVVLARPVIKQIEYVLLPGNTTQIAYSDYHAGPHTLVMSGYADMNLVADPDDDNYLFIAITLDIPLPVWSRSTAIRTSTIITLADIVSPDSDEVDHSRWTVAASTTGHYDEKYVPEQEGAPVTYYRKLRVSAKFGLQGEYNRLEGFGFHIVANGA